MFGREFQLQALVCSLWLMKAGRADCEQRGVGLFFWGRAVVPGEAGEEAAESTCGRAGGPGGGGGGWSHCCAILVNMTTRVNRSAHSSRVSGLTRNQMRQGLSRYWEHAGGADGALDCPARSPEEGQSKGPVLMEWRRKVAFSPLRFGQLARAQAPLTLAERQARSLARMMASVSGKACPCESPAKP